MIKIFHDDCIEAKVGSFTSGVLLAGEELSKDGCYFWIINAVFFSQINIS